MRRSIYNPEHDSFRAAFRAFLNKAAVPFVDEWEAAGTPDREFIVRAAEAGYIGFELDPEFGGLGIDDFRFNAIICEEVIESETAGDTFSMQNDVIVPYLRDLASPEQRARWFARFSSGRLVTALAMTEPGAGSDLASIVTTARRDGDELVINGAKTFITSGSTCDLALILARTGERDGRGTTFVAVESGTPGFRQGQPLRKIGRKAQDTAELSFEDVRVPVANIVGEPGRGFASAVRNLPRERLTIAVSGVASARHAFDLALRHLRDRVAFGAPLAHLQSVRMALAEMHSDVAVVETFVDRCVLALNAGDLTPEDAAAAKYKATELQWEVLDRTLQMFGGYGYMEEYPIARMWRDARVQRIYGGANEVMKDLIGRSLVGR